MNQCKVFWNFSLDYYALTVAATAGSHCENKVVVARVSEATLSLLRS